MCSAEIVTEIKDYDAFQLIEIASFDAFLNVHSDIKEITSSFLKLNNKKQNQLSHDPLKTSIPLMQSILDQIENHHFLVFEKDDEIYKELEFLNRSKLMHIQLNDIKEKYVYIIISDFQRLIAI